MMRPFTLAELGAPLGGRLLAGDARFGAVSTDSRHLPPGALFVALRGPRFDGHEFVGAARDAGAVAALVERAVAAQPAAPPPQDAKPQPGGDPQRQAKPQSGAKPQPADAPLPAPLPALQVDDTLAALGRLAALNRDQFTGGLVGITGSSGKTTVKAMLAAVLGELGPTLATEGNHNNEVGVPLTLLRLAPQHRYAVVEMAAAKPGDIRYLADMVKPRVAVLLNAMPAHLEGFGSVDAVARAKGELFEALPAGATAIINADSPHAPLWRQLAAGAEQISFGLGDGDGADTDAAAVINADSDHAHDRAPLWRRLVAMAKQISFGLGDGADTGAGATPTGATPTGTAPDVTATGITAVAGAEGGIGSRFTLVTPAGDVPVELALPGRHQVRNALATAAAALALGATPAAIAAGLGKVRPGPGRGARHTLPSGAWLIDDSYNANPGSVGAAIDLLASLPGRRWLVLGGMAELGADSEALHRQVGEHARRAALDHCWTTGGDSAAAARAFGPGGRYFDNRNALLAALGGELTAGDTVLVKGSRSAGMEQLVAALTGVAGSTIDTAGTPNTTNTTNTTGEGD